MFLKAITMDLARVEIELRERLDYPYRWGRKQSDAWDRDTRFIYTTYSFKTLLERCKSFPKEKVDYAMNRWYNFWSAKAAEYIFSSHQQVVANRNPYDKLVDFEINGMPFDHKTTKFPKAYGKSYDYALTHKADLILWLYKNQSQQGRKHFKNRLFIVLFDSVALHHWKLKADIQELKIAIDTYLENYDSKKLISFDFGDGTVLSDIIWLTK